mmetsp:Transcript_2779/g.4332  ORF Transcript_2779/g.4332 Transcript_2779/m.4332 type:complete len:370 (+) Transcript_2779:229-1338(+)|eukprot:CAMPEP_0196807484 /NCGR_PEP_ID=MMETSP1362-20130617/7452_1 /TAXON_ID=163516 /ORGANISM="Leptocylindrus danicus, Strain CCMP1856" /LENGTH=369 /DNA_ID=CAMNT_0042181433 /DNA_START=179 /DNA_END=1288 /DNA_ORIENTATION=+
MITTTGTTEDGQNIAQSIPMKPGPINCLLPESIAHILSFLGFDDLTNCSCISTDWMDAVSKLDIVQRSINVHNEPRRSKVARRRFAHLHSVFIACDEMRVTVNPVLLRRFLLPYCSTMKRLCVGGDYAFLGNTLKLLSKVNSLESLTLHDCRFGSVSDLIEVFETKTNLQLLRLTTPKFGARYNPPSLRDYRQLASSIGKLQSLKALVLEDWDLNIVSDAMILMFSNLQQLEALVVGKANDEVLTKVAEHCPNLNEFKIMGHTKAGTLTMSGVMKVVRGCRITTLHIPYLQGYGNGAEHVREIVQCMNTRARNYHSEPGSISKPTLELIVGVRLCNDSSVSFRRKRSFMMAAADDIVDQEKVILDMIIV